MKLPEERRKKTYPKVQNWVSHLQKQKLYIDTMVKQKKTYTPRSTDQARQPPSGNGERGGTASVVVGLDSKLASLSSIEVSRSSRSLCLRMIIQTNQLSQNSGWQCDSTKITMILSS